MSSSLVLMSPIALPESLPPALPTPKYSIGEQVTWCHTTSQDFGRIVGLVYAAEASVSATGFHYAIALDPASPSAALGVTADWGFEADLAPLVTAAHLPCPTTTPTVA